MISNTARFCHALYANAWEYYKVDNVERAEDICRTLTSDFTCPKSVQVQAWQLRSLCASDHDEARDCLTKCIRLFDDLPKEDDEEIKAAYEHTRSMQRDLFDRYVNEWKTWIDAPASVESTKVDEAVGTTSKIEKMVERTEEELAELRERDREEMAEQLQGLNIAKAEEVGKKYSDDGERVTPPRTSPPEPKPQDDDEMGTEDDPMDLDK